MCVRGRGLKVGRDIGGNGMETLGVGSVEYDRLTGDGRVRARERG